MAQSSQVTPVTGVQHQEVGTAGPVELLLTNGNRRTPWRPRIFSPYQKTPHTRALRTDLRRLAKGTGSRYVRTPPRGRDNTSVSELVNKTWRVYRVSPLYLFSHRNSDLTSYSKQLSGHIEAEIQKGLAFDSESEKASAATFSVFKGLKSCPADKEAIQITLKQKPKKFKTSDDMRVALTAVLCSVECQADVAQSLPGCMSLLPVMLVKGPVGLTEMLITWLQTQFDCCINLMKFSPTSLSWMVAMWSGYTKEKGGKPVELCYRVPKEVTGLSTITMTMEAKGCKKLWDSIHEKEDETFRDDEVVTFIKALEAHFYHHFKVNLGAMPLSRVGTSTAYVGVDGRLKIFSLDRLHQVLGHITEVVLEQYLSFS